MVNGPMVNCRVRLISCIVWPDIDHAVGVIDIGHYDAAAIRLHVT